MRSSSINITVNSVSVELDSDAWTLLLEQSMLVLIIAARWLMPKGDLSKEQLSGSLENEHQDIILSTDQYCFLDLCE